PGSDETSSVQRAGGETRPPPGRSRPSRAMGRAFLRRSGYRLSDRGVERRLAMGPAAVRQRYAQSCTFYATAGAGSRITIPALPRAVLGKRGRPLAWFARLTTGGF